MRQHSPKTRATWRRLSAGLSCAAAAALLVSACSTSSSAGGGGSTPPAGTRMPTGTTAHATTAPHIMILVMENESYGQVFSKKAAPFTSSLATKYLRATSSYARGHNSLPNYLEMVSGRAYEGSGTSNDCTPSSCGRISGRTLADQLGAAGIRWQAFMGDMPSACDTSDAGGDGGYGVRHDPFVYFPQGKKGPECGHVVPAARMRTALNSKAPPAFVFYSPTICQDGGTDASCSTIANGDRFLARQIPQIMATSWYRHGGTIILTWDEGNDNSGKHGDNGGHVLTVVISARTKGKAPYQRYVDTAGILRTVEHAYGRSYLGDAAKASSGTLPLGSRSG